MHRRTSVLFKRDKSDKENTMLNETNRREFMKLTATTTAGVWSGANLEIAALALGVGIPSNAETPRATGAAISQEQVPLAPPEKQPSDLKIPEPVKRKIGWAVVGLGKLALEEVMPAFREAKLSQPVALVSGHPDKARKVAEAYGMDVNSIYNYENFDRIAENERIQAVYIILPNNMHAEFTLRGFKAGKHILCEKPMSVTVEEGERMIAAAQQAQRKLMIAYRLHYEPYNRKVMELCRARAIGELKTFSASNCQDVQAPNIRLSRALGGGPVGDVGVYCINAARYVLNEEPIEVTAFANQPKDDPRFREVPESVVFALHYPSGALAHCECGFGHARTDRYRVVGDQGFIELDPAFAYVGQRLYRTQGDPKEGDAQKIEIQLQPVNHFAEEMDHFSECILQNTQPRTPGELGLADMRIITAIYEAIRTGRAARVGS